MMSSAGYGYPSGPGVRAGRRASLQREGNLTSPLVSFRSCSDSSGFLDARISSATPNRPFVALSRKQAYREVPPLPISVTSKRRSAKKGFLAAHNGRISNFRGLNGDRSKQDKPFCTDSSRDDGNGALAAEWQGAIFLSPGPSDDGGGSPGGDRECIRTSLHLNFHRPCGFATVGQDARGKRKRECKAEDYATPYEKLKSLPGAEECLKRR